jgi:hypothetical protein
MDEKRISNIEQGISNVEVKTHPRAAMLAQNAGCQRFLTSEFDIPCSIFDIRRFFRPPYIA